MFRHAWKHFMMSALAVALGGASSAWAAAKWDMPTRSNERNHFTQNIAVFAKDIATATDGELTITIHPEDSLIKQQDLKRAIQTGQVPIGEFLVSLYGNEHAIFDIDAQPFLASGLEENALLLEVARPYLAERLKRQGLRLLFVAPWPGNSLYSKTELNSLYDLKGSKFRAFNPVTGRFAELVGATPVTVQQAEVSQAFSTGVIDAMITSPATGVDTHAWDFVKHYTDVAAMSTWNLVVVNERAFSRLSESVQQAVLKASEEAEARAWANTERLTAELIQVLRDRGMVVKETTDTMRGEIQDLRKVFIDEWVKRAGDDGAKIIEAFESRRGKQ